MRRSDVALFLFMCLTKSMLWSGLLVLIYDWHVVALYAPLT